MQKFNEWLSLRETVSFEVDMPGIKFAPKNTSELAYQVNNKLRAIPGFLKATNPEQLTIDGADVNAAQGILNFYTAGLDDDTISRSLKAISYYIPEFGGLLTGQVKKDQSRLFGSTVYRIPVKMGQNSQKRPPEVNMTNNVAEVILRDMMGMKDWAVGSLSARELMMKINSISDFAMNMGVSAPSQDKNVYDGGISPERLKRQLAGLESLCKWAIDNNYDTIKFA